MKIDQRALIVKRKTESRLDVCFADRMSRWQTASISFEAIHLKGSAKMQTSNILRAFFPEENFDGS
jgi:hypothetical protein